MCNFGNTITYFNVRQLMEESLIINFRKKEKIDDKSLIESLKYMFIFMDRLNLMETGDNVFYRLKKNITKQDQTKIRYYLKLLKNKNKCV